MQRHSWTNNRQPVFWRALPGRYHNGVFSADMVDVLAAPQQAKTDSSLRTLAAISLAHWVSHFHLFVLPMLFPFLKEQLGVGYIELGFAITVLGIVSGLTQAPIGYLADHIGARKVLLMGLALGGFALVMLGLNLSYPWLLVCAGLLGLANSVYHPADYAILSAHMDEARMGRAFSIHTFAGFLGGAVAPAIMATLVATVGGTGALIAAGAVGLLVALVLIAVGIPDASAADRHVDGVPPPKQSIITPAIIVLTIFFMLLGLSNAGISNFGVVALISGYGASFAGGQSGADRVSRLQRHWRAGRRLSRRPHQPPWTGRRRLFCRQRGHHAGDCDHHPAVAAADGDDGGGRISRRRDRAVARHAGAQRRPARVLPAVPSASSPPASTSPASSARCCTAGSWTRACRTGCSARPSCS